MKYQLMYNFNTYILEEVDHDCLKITVACAESGGARDMRIPKSLLNEYVKQQVGQAVAKLLFPPVIPARKNRVSFI